MSAHYIVRFDDICPSMNWTNWDRIETILTLHDVRPILAVVPDNLDPKLSVDTPRADFWERVRNWQAQGWTIALHGYQHLYVTNDPGLVGINSYSEFAGLPYVIQREKIERGLSILVREGIRADAWIAPAHSFDATTVRVLVECGVKVISDGFFWRPVSRMGAVWIPQQFWHFRPMPFGLWTVCFHHNNMSERDIGKLESDISKYRNAIVALDTITKKGCVAPHGAFDALFSICWLAKLTRKKRSR